MRKIRLDLDAVEVESFNTEASAGVKGTVDGHLRSRIGDTYCQTCFFEDTCDCVSQFGTCDFCKR